MGHRATAPPLSLSSGEITTTVATVPSWTRDEILVLLHLLILLQFYWFNEW
jgi:hypothetical protein